MKDVTDCRLCPRLVEYLQQTRLEYPDYHCQPVPAYGDARASLLIVGLAPGKHGANASGIPFTGDAAGSLLFRTLFDFGFSSQANSSAASPAELQDCRITNAVKCLPPNNKPSAAEIIHCNRYLRQELASMHTGSVILALGRIAHGAIIRAQGQRQADYPFAHGALHDMAGRWQLIDSYHCSRYNTQTGRLNADMFNAVFSKIRVLLGMPRHEC